MKQYRGICAAPGLVIAPLHRLNHSSPAFTRMIEAPHREKARLAAAIALAQEELQELEERSLRQSSKDIFFFQTCLLEDEGFLNSIYAEIGGGLGAAQAVEKAGRASADKLQALKDNEYMQLRAADIIDASRRVINILDGRPRQTPPLDHPVILIGETLLPSDLAIASGSMIRGVALAHGSAQSHAAIIARGMNIPGLIHLGTDFLENADGHIAILDGESATLTINPTPEVRLDAVRRICAMQIESDDVFSVRDLPCVTKGGTAFSIVANCFGPEDIAAAMHAGASGVGLVRSEYLLMGGRSPDEEEQYRFYADCLRAAGGAEVAIRTFDVGADITTRSLGEKEPNPELGQRGIRFCLSHPDLFETQLCALLRAGREGPLSVNLPMVCTPDDWERAMYYVERAKQHLRGRGIPFAEHLPFGITLETPAACLEAALFPPLGCRFFALGLNDLVQYTHAADRNSSEIAPYYQSNSPAIRRLIAFSVEAAEKAGVPISANGLALEKPDYAISCMALGIHSFSLTAQHILDVKKSLIESEV